jgi:iron complex outermembrane receptor protein
LFLLNFFVVKKTLFLLLFICCISKVQAQNCRLKLTGHVHSTVAHENLPNASITLEEKGKTIITNDNGDFVFDSLCAGTYTVHISHVTFDTVTRIINLKANAHADFDLVPTKGNLAEVTVRTSRGVQVTGIRKDLSGKELDETRGLSLAEALSKITGVTMLQTGSSISKPVIHGLHSNRILTINNGVRQEGQQWGNEHAPEIDPFIADRLTVIKGVDELRYGSDAIGGVILVDPKPLRSLPGYNAEINTGYFTNNRHYILSGVWEQQLKQLPSFTYRLQGTFKKAANAATPDYRLNNTGSDEKNFSATIARRGEHYNAELFYSYFNTTIGIFSGSHIGNITDLNRAVQSSRPDPVFTSQNTYKINRPYQAVEHHLLKWKSAVQAGANKFNVLIAGQFNGRSEFDIVRSSTNTKPQLDLDIYTLSEDISWEHPKKNNLTGVLGVAAMQQDNSYSGRYFIPNYKSNTFGGYLIEKWNKNKWDAQAGLRYDNKNINTNRLLSNGTVFDRYSFQFSTFGSSFNVGYKQSNMWKINSNISLSSRAPHVNELLSNGIHHGTATFEEGDINLKPERSVNVSLNSSYTNVPNTVTFDVSLYRNNIQNFIYQKPVPNEPVLTIAGAFPKLIYSQTDAVLQGIDFSSAIKLGKNIEWVNKYSILRAKDKTKNDWLILMPSDRIFNEITYNFNTGKKFTKSYVSLELQNVFTQTRVPDEKNGKQDYKDAPEGYALLNADFSTTIEINKLPFTFSLSGRNLLNTSYREYLNSMRYFTDEQGRNIGIRMKIPIEHLY